MKSYAMRRFAFLSLAAIFTIFVIAVVGTSKFASDDKHAGHHQAQVGGSTQTPKVDGSINASLIPDVDAQEILFKILSATNPNDKYETQRKSSFLKTSGFNEAEAAAIINVAYEYKRLIDPLDAEVDGIKMQHWPNPSTSVMTQLAQLQRQKETVIANSLIYPLKVQLINYDPSGQKLDNFIVSGIKRKTKGFARELPKQKTGKLEKYFSNLFAASAQAPGCDTLVYVYSSTWVDYTDGMVYCDNSFSVPYNNCGHQYTLSFTMDNQTNPYLPLWGADRAGVIQTLAEVEGYCPVVQQSFPSGQNSSQVTVDTYVEITGLTVNHTNLNSTQNSTTATVTYALSGATNKTIKYQPGWANLSGIDSSHVTVDPNVETTFTANGSAITYTYTRNTEMSGTFQPYCIFKDGTARVLGASPTTPKTIIGSQVIHVNGG